MHPKKGTEIFGPFFNAIESPPWNPTSGLVPLPMDGSMFNCNSVAYNSEDITKSLYSGAGSSHDLQLSQLKSNTKVTLPSFPYPPLPYSLHSPHHRYPIY